MIMTRLEKIWQLLQRPQKTLENVNSSMSITESHQDLEKLIADNPKFHSLEGVPTSWSIQTDTLRFLYSLLKPGMVTLKLAVDRQQLSLLLQELNILVLCLTLRKPIASNNTVLVWAAIIILLSSSIVRI